MEEYFHNEPMSIVLHGISMGGATVLMVSGEELSDNVKLLSLIAAIQVLMMNSNTT